MTFCQVIYCLILEILNLLSFADIITLIQVFILFEIFNWFCSTIMLLSRGC